MSYANFKKVHEDESHARFKHANGSELKVAKGGLSPKMRKELEGLPLYADGGDVPSSLQANDPLDSQDQVDSGVPGINININHQPADPMTQDPAYQNMLSGYKSKVEPGSAEERVMGSPEEQASKDYSLMKSYQRNPGEMSQMDIAKAKGFESPDPIAMPSTPGGEVASNGPGLEGAQSPPGLAADPAAAPVSPAAMPQVAPMPAAPMAHAQPSTPQEHYEATKQQLSAEDQAWQHDLANGHITPKTYQDLFAKKDTLGKIGTIFGLMLSGAGSGLSGQPNALMELMNKEIKNDLDSQVQSKTNAQNFIKLNQQHELNQANVKNIGADTALKAKTLANMQMNQAALHSLVLQAQKYPIGSPQRIQADQTLAMLSQGVQSENFSLMDRAAAGTAYFKTMSGIGGVGGDGQSGQDAQVANRLQFLRMNNPKMADDLEKRYVPGVGVSSVNVPDGVRQDLVSKQKLLDTGNDLMEYSKNHSNIVPGTPEYRYGVSKAMAFQQQVREGMLGTVFRESEKPLLEKFVSENPAGALKAFSTQPKLRAILDTTKIGMDTQKKAYGLPSGGGDPQQQQAAGHPLEGKTASDGHGNKIVMQGGRWVPVGSMAKK